MDAGNPLDQYLLDSHSTASASELLRQRNSPLYSIFLWVIFCIGCGCIWGFAEKSSEGNVYSVFQKIFFFSWTIKFYPQIYLNAKRKTSAGLSIDTVCFSFFGHGCLCVYAIFTSYKLEAFGQTSKFDSAISEIETFLIAHSTTLTVLTVFQMYYLDGYRKVRVARKTNICMSLYVIINVIYLGLVNDNFQSTSINVSLNEWLVSLLYGGGLFLSLRDIPQAWRFYRATYFQGVCLTTVVLELLGSMSILIAFIVQGSGNSAIGTAGGVVIQKSFEASILLSVVAAFTILFDTIYLCEAVFYSHQTPPRLLEWIEKDGSEVAPGTQQDLNNGERRFYEFSDDTSFQPQAPIDIYGKPGATAASEVSTYVPPTISED